jgi:nucleoid-associated protein YgaU
VENDAYIPSPGDAIFYDWEDKGSGDNTGAPNHIGIVVSVTGSNIKVIEGNMDNKVGYRTININGRYIRGYGVPKYYTKAVVEPDFKVGDTVMFNGTKHYTNSYAIAIGRSCKPGEAVITNFVKGKTHPYHLKAVAGKGSTVHGWVNEKDIAEIPAVKTYVVKKGDNLTKIARAYGTTVGVLAKINNIENVNLIRVGQIIKLP